jgi:molybdopterin molybdotransferase
VAEVLATGMVPLEEARSAVLEDCWLLPFRPVPVARALGLVTATSVVAWHDVPPFTNSAMDGYALRAADTSPAPASLTVTGVLPAGGDPRRLRVEAGQAVRIATGAGLPEGADAVVMAEWTTPTGDLVLVHRPVEPGANVRPAGDDLWGGQVVFPARTTITPAHIGVLASAGVTAVPAHSRARVAVISTGDELSEDRERLGPGRIPDSNRPMLLALLAQAGCDVVDGGAVADDPAALEQAFAGMLEQCDVLVTSGGVSVGERDHVAGVVGALGTVTSMKIAIKPSKPLVFGDVCGKPVFGLPGNPVSSLVSFELFVRPALRKMMGHAAVDRPRVRAVAEEDFARRQDGKIHFVRAVATRAEDGFGVRYAGAQGSHQLSAAARANALVVLPDGGGATAGETVEALLLFADC